MAIVARGQTPCALCGRPVEAEDDVVATSHFVQSRFDRFDVYSDVPFHQACFMRWPARPAFVARFNELAAGRAPTGSVPRMRGDGQVSSQRAARFRRHAPTIPREHGHPYIALQLPTRERRPGLHVAVAPPGPLPGARLVISIELPAGAGHLTGLVAGDVLVGPIEHARTMMATGDGALPAVVLAKAPPDFEHTPDAPAADALFIAAGGCGRDVVPLPRSEAYVVLSRGRFVGVPIRAWAVRAQ